VNAPPIDTKVPPAFVIGLFAVAIIVGVAIAYLGITGQIGTGIP
jgi:hypothetical protein